MATATAPPTTASPPATGIYPTVADALVAGARVAARIGGGIPVVVPLADGTARLQGIVLDESAPPVASEANAGTLRSLFAAWDAEVWDEEETRRSERAMKAMGVPGYEDVVLDENPPSNGGA